MRNILTLAQVLELIRTRAADAGSQKAFAAEIGVNNSVLSEVLNERRDPPNSLLEALEIVREVRFIFEDEKVKTRRRPAGV